MIYLYIMLRLIFKKRNESLFFTTGVFFYLNSLFVVLIVIIFVINFGSDSRNESTCVLMLKKSRNNFLWITHKYTRIYPTTVLN